MSKRSYPGLLAAALLVWGGALQAQSVTAIRVAAAPVIDGIADDAAWSDAPAAELSAGLTLKAVHDGATLSVLAMWPDATFSATRGGSWTWDGSAWSTDPSSGQGEDRLALMWNINASGFAEQGCAVKCHVPSVYLETPGERADMWHMKAARSLGVLEVEQMGAVTVDPATHEVTAGSVRLSGFVDDKYVGEDGGDDAGRYGDEGSSTYGRNRNSDKSGPLYLEAAPTDYADAMVLTQAEVDAGEVIVVAEVSADDITAAWQAYADLGAVVPERVLRLPAGSRGDVRNAATWTDGMWTSEFQRPLVTGNDDDVQFDSLGGSYLFGVGIFDNSGDMNKDMSNSLLSLTFSDATAVSALSWGDLKILIND